MIIWISYFVVMSEKKGMKKETASSPKPDELGNVLSQVMR